MSRLSEKRLLRELSVIAERYPTMRLRSEPDESPRFEGTIEVHGANYRVRLVLPPIYPRVPPQVHELDPETGDELPADGRPRRLGGAGICLFPHGNDSQAWRPEEGLAVDALDRFCEFIVCEQADFQLFLAEQELVIPPELVDKLLTEGPGQLRCRFTPAGKQLFAAEVRFEREPLVCYPAPGWSAAWSSFLPFEVEFPWLVLETDAPWAELIGSRARLEATLREHLPAAVYERRRDVSRWLLVRQSQVGCDDRVDMRCVDHRPGDERSLLQLNIVRSTARDLLFQRVDGVLSQRGALASETVVMIGLGSLGSVTALALARAGIERFVLVDPETLTLENICRHVGSVRDIGRLKVDVVAEAILAVNPDAQITPAPRWFAWDLSFLSAGIEIDAILAGSDRVTVVSTCANGVTELELNALAITHEVPAIYAAALGAAEHGRIFRVIPGRSPCLECILAAQDEDPDIHPRYIAPGLPTEAPPPYLQPGLPGLAIDLGQIALLIARFTLQTLAEVRGLSLGIPSEVGDHLLWTNRGGWLFDRPIQLRVEDFPRSSDCPVCGSTVTSESLTTSEHERLSQLRDQLRGTME